MRIAILDDDDGQAEFLQNALQNQGHLCSCFSLGRELVRQLKTESFDLFVLEWRLPDISGREVLEWIRAHDIRMKPVIFVSTPLFEADVVCCLDAGADDYLAKPVRPCEFSARVAALLRRSYQSTQAVDGTEIFGQYQFNHCDHSVKCDGAAVQLTQKEYALALLFFRNLGSPLSRQHMLEAVWRIGDDASTCTLDTHLSRIRHKLHLSPASGYRLIPVYGFGYRLDRIEQNATLTLTQSRALLATVKERYGAISFQDD